MYKTENALYLALLISSLVLFVLIGTMTAFMLRFYYKKVAIQKALQKRNLTRAEDEHKRIAENIQTTLEPQLQQLKLELESLSPLTEGPTSLVRPIKLVDRLIRQAKELRAILLPARLESDGLAAALQDLCKIIEAQNGISIILRVATYERLQYHRELHIFRIVEETLQNIVSHANASQVLITLATHDELMTLAIVDDGVGIDLSEVKKSNPALGLRTILAHADQLDAEIHLNGQQGEGTELIIQIPR